MSSYRKIGLTTVFLTPKKSNKSGAKNAGWASKSPKMSYFEEVMNIFLMGSKIEGKNWIYSGIFGYTKFKKSWSKNGILATESWKKEKLQKRCQNGSKATI